MDASVLSFYLSFKLSLKNHRKKVALRYLQTIKIYVSLAQLMNCKIAFRFCTKYNKSREQ